MTRLHPASLPVLPPREVTAAQAGASQRTCSIVCARNGPLDHCPTNAHVSKQSSGKGYGNASGKQKGKKKNVTYSKMRDGFQAGASDNGNVCPTPEA